MIKTLNWNTLSWTLVPNNTSEMMSSVGYVAFLVWEDLSSPSSVAFLQHDAKMMSGIKVSTHTVGLEFCTLEEKANKGAQ